MAEKAAKVQRKTFDRHLEKPSSCQKRPFLNNTRKSESSQAKYIFLTCGQKNLYKQKPSQPYIDSEELRSSLLVFVWGEQQPLSDGELKAAECQSQFVGFPSSELRMVLKMGHKSYFKNKKGKCGFTGGRPDWFWLSQWQRCKHTLGLAVKLPQPLLWHPFPSASMCCTSQRRCRLCFSLDESGSMSVHGYFHVHVW